MIAVFRGPPPYLRASVFVNYLFFIFEFYLMYMLCIYFLYMYRFTVFIQHVDSMNVVLDCLYEPSKVSLASSQMLVQKWIEIFVHLFLNFAFLMFFGMFMVFIYRLYFTCFLHFRMPVDHCEVFHFSPRTSTFRKLRTWPIFPPSIDFSLVF